MKRIAIALISLCLLATGANSFWQSRQQVSIGGAPPAGPVVTYVSQVTPSSGIGTTTLTMTGVDIGNPAYISSRRVIIVQSGGSSLGVPTSGTINLVPIDQMTALSGSCGGSNCIEFLSAPVPSGTTGVTIVINYATALGFPSFQIYNVDEALLSSITPVAAFTENTTGTGTDTTTVNTTTKAGGFILAGAWVGGGSGPSITASTESYTSDYSASANFSAHANSITSNASNSVSTQGPPAGGFSGLGLAAYR